MRKKNKITGADTLLLMLYLDNQSSIDGAIRLTKMMFLFDKEIVPILNKNGLDIENLPEFFAYNYGPFSKDVYEQLDLFSSIKFIKIDNLKSTDKLMEVDDLQEPSFINETYESDSIAELDDDGKYYRYKIEKLGKEFVEKNIIDNISPCNCELLTQFKKKINNLPPKAILKYVYTNYPDSAKNSIIKDEVLGNE